MQPKQAVIILIYETSASGKTTIYQNLQKLINPMQIDSTDSAFKRLELNDFNHILQYISANNDQFSHLSQVQDIFIAFWPRPFRSIIRNGL